MKMLTSDNAEETAPGPQLVCRRPASACTAREGAVVFGAARQPTFCRLKAVFQLGEDTGCTEAASRTAALPLETPRDGGTGQALC